MFMKHIAALLFQCAALSTLAQTTIYYEEFSGSDLPPGWHQTSNASDGGWKGGTGPALSSLFFQIPDNGSDIIATNDDACWCDKSADIV